MQRLKFAQSEPHAGFGALRMRSRRRLLYITRVIGDFAQYASSRDWGLGPILGCRMTFSNWLHALRSQPHAPPGTRCECETAVRFGDDRCSGPTLEQ